MSSGIYLNPFKLDPLRKMAGLEQAQYSVYYNLAGPDKDHAVGRIDGDDVFVVEMNRTGYDSLIQENNPKQAYIVLYKLYKDEPEIEPTKKLDLMESLLGD